MNRISAALVNERCFATAWKTCMRLSDKGVLPPLAILRQQVEVGLDPHVVLADCLHAGNAALGLLRHRMNIAQPALEGVALEDRGCSGLEEHHLDRLARLRDLVRARGAQFDADRKTDFAGG